MHSSVKIAGYPTGAGSDPGQDFLGPSRAHSLAQGQFLDGIQPTCRDDLGRDSALLLRGGSAGAQSLPLIPSRGTVPWETLKRVMDREVAVPFYLFDWLATSASIQ